jgi:hypothetical protein
MRVGTGEVDQIWTSFCITVHLPGHRHEQAVVPGQPGRVEGDGAEGEQAKDVTQYLAVSGLRNAHRGRLRPGGTAAREGGGFTGLGGGVEARRVGRVGGIKGCQASVVALVPGSFIRP